MAGWWAAKGWFADGHNGSIVAPSVDTHQVQTGQQQNRPLVPVEVQPAPAPESPVIYQREAH